MRLASVTLITLIIALTTSGLSAMDIRFDRNEELSYWKIINDGVMGGLSKSQVAIVEKQLVFSGIVSLDNNGGFASARRVQLTAESGIDRIKIRLKGDGKIYKLRLCTSGAWDGISYSVDIHTEKGIWISRSFDADEFTPTWRGRTVPDAPALDLSQIKQIGIMIADKQQGPFKVFIRAIDLFSS